VPDTGLNNPALRTDTVSMPVPGTLPPPELLYSDILTEGPPAFIRAPTGGNASPAARA
jgi:hypothetical protein